MKDYKKAHYYLDEKLVLTVNYGTLVKGVVVSVVDPLKLGSRYKIKVQDARDRTYDIPSKYLKRI